VPPSLEGIRLKPREVPAQRTLYQQKRSFTQTKLRKSTVAPQLQRQLSKEDQGVLEVRQIAQLAPTRKISHALDK